MFSWPIKMLQVVFLNMPNSKTTGPEKRQTPEIPWQIVPPNVIPQHKEPCWFVVWIWFSMAQTALRVHPDIQLLSGARRVQHQHL